MLLSQLTSTEESIFVNLLLPVVAVEPILALFTADHLHSNRLPKLWMNGLALLVTADVL